MLADGGLRIVAHTLVRFIAPHLPLICSQHLHVVASTRHTIDTKPLGILAIVVVCILLTGIWGCSEKSSVPPTEELASPNAVSSSEDSTLIRTQKAKLDLNLRLLIERGHEASPVSYEWRKRPSGEKAFAVLVRLQEGRSLETSELPLDDSNQVATGFLTISEIIQAARQDAVLSIATPPPASTYKKQR